MVVGEVNDGSGSVPVPAVESLEKRVERSVRLPESFPLWRVERERGETNDFTSRDNAYIQFYFKFLLVFPYRSFFPAV